MERASRSSSHELGSRNCFPKIFLNKYKNIYVQCSLFLVLLFFLMIFVFSFCNVFRFVLCVVCVVRVWFLCVVGVYGCCVFSSLFFPVKVCKKCF